MHDAPRDVFEQLVAEAVPVNGRFGHREHVKVTWLALRRYGLAHARRLIDEGIRSTARYAGVPQKFNATISRAWVEAVAYHLRAAPDAGFDEFVRANPALLDKRLLTHFYRSSTLASPAARTDWVPPDLSPFPWT
jgi:hypothetical protein